jgi:hypothetical protein
VNGRKIDFGGHDWSAHAQDHWLDFAGNPNFPDYLRIVFVAYGRHRANGHARLQREELARFLVRKDGTLPDRRNIRHSIDRAVELGYLMPSSRALCLVVSSLHVQGGIGDPDRRCDRDHTIRGKDASGVRPSAGKDVTGSSRFARKDVGEQRRSTLAPSIFSPSPRAAPARDAS